MVEYSGQKIKKYFIQRWGEFFYWLCFLVNVIFVLNRPEEQRGHYRVFAGAGQALWHSQNPYQVDFPGTTSGYYLYSIGCGWLYGLFSFLPEAVGIGLFSLLSATVFYRGLSLLMTSFEERGWVVSLGYRNFFWLVLSSELIGSILSNKLELLIVGLMFFSMALILKKQQFFWAGFISAITLDWKFISLPLIAFLLFHQVIFKRSGKFFAGFFLCLSFWHWIPSQVYSASLLAEMREKHQATLMRQLHDFSDFDHLYHFLKANFRTVVSFQEMLIIAIMAASIFGVYFLWWGLRLRKLPLADDLFMILSLALSGFYVTCFSPLSQAQGYILYVPLLLACLLLDQHLPDVWRRGLRRQVVISWILISLLLSDLFPHSVRVLAEERGAKPFGVALLGIGFIFSFRKLKMFHHTAQSFSQAREGRKT